MSVDAVLRARATSTRLPGKTLLEAAGKTMLEHTVNRVSAARRIDRVVVATTESPEDDAIGRLCERIGVPSFRGSETDVLGRVHDCAKLFGMEHVAHFGADNPLVDPAICDEVIDVYLAGDWDYVTNNYPPTFPDGLEVEVTSFAVLETIAAEATDARHREHLLTYVWDHPERFRIRNVERSPALNHERWTLDAPEDVPLVTAVLEALAPVNPEFGLADVLEYLDARPELRPPPASQAERYDWLEAGG